MCLHVGDLLSIHQPSGVAVLRLVGELSGDTAARKHRYREIAWICATEDPRPGEHPDLTLNGKGSPAKAVEHSVIFCDLENLLVGLLRMIQYCLTRSSSLKIPWHGIEIYRMYCQTCATEYHFLWWNNETVEFFRQQPVDTQAAKDFAHCVEISFSLLSITSRWRGRDLVKDDSNMIKICKINQEYGETLKEMGKWSVNKYVLPACFQDPGLQASCLSAPSQMSEISSVNSWRSGDHTCHHTRSHGHTSIQIQFPITPPLPAEAMDSQFFFVQSSVWNSSIKGRKLSASIRALLA